MKTKRIALISTGGTIEKTYDELRGVLVNEVSVLEVILAGLELGGVHLTPVHLMNKDSLEMTEADHIQITECAEIYARTYDGIIVVHGTDRLTQTGETMVRMLGVPRVPIILTGAMRPYALRTTDAVQNLTESMLAVQLLAPGVYVVLHNKVLPMPGVKKDPERRTFVRMESPAEAS